MSDVQEASIQSDPVFFRNYNRIIGTAYASILLGITLFFGIQLQQRLMMKSTSFMAM
ncbi:hypothetical protein HC248_01484 [Polaromonas vacuolata]|uniref:Uncharacterized protein n=1 Tax=Polaromonas vacuolata TaxID=37448 RepID=A0A6H2H8H1_9BURK|nr:hypothetical protein [Polaromonas vacuolata]QJC56182.1 hypothetical protein HC248_01484 [Polaromonas vacuolata]